MCVFRDFAKEGLVEGEKNTSPKRLRQHKAGEFKIFVIITDTSAQSQVDDKVLFKGNKTKLAKMEGKKWKLKKECESI